MSNFLEQMVAEWYEYKGYFVRRNILVGKREKGGYECELDVVAFNPAKNHLIHIEPSMDADSWQIREKRYLKKFEAGKSYIPGLFSGFNLPNDIEHIALFGFASKQNHETLSGFRVMLIDEFLNMIFTDLRDKHPSSNAISEQLIIIRAYQFAAEHIKTINDAIEK